MSIQIEGNFLSGEENEESMAGVHDVGSLWGSIKKAGRGIGRTFSAPFRMSKNVHVVVKPPRLPSRKYSAFAYRMPVVTGVTAPGFKSEQEVAFAAGNSAQEALLNVKAIITRKFPRLKITKIKMPQ